jgi:hypothetical protein
VCRTSTSENTWFCSRLVATRAETERGPENPLKNSLFCWVLSKGHSELIRHQSASRRKDFFYEKFFAARHGTIWIS